MPFSRRRVATLVFLIAAAVAIILFGTRQWEDWSELRAEAAGYPWDVGGGWLAMAGLLGIGALAGTARVWAWLFERAGGRTAPREAMAAWLGSNLGRYLPGKIWQLTGLAVYLRARGDSGAAGVAVSLALQAVTLLTGVAVGASFAGSELVATIGSWRLVLLVVFLVVCAQPGVIRWLVRLGGRLLREEGTGDIALPRRDLGMVVLLTLGVWVVTGLGFWTLLQGLVGPAAPSALIATGIYATSYVIGYLVLIAPGGLVVREGMMTGLLASLAGMPLAVAAAIAVAARLWMTGAELVAFGLVAGGRTSPDTED